MVFLAIVAFCFSMTVGVLWEFFECAMDRFFGMDMQKDTIIHGFSSVMLDPTHSNIPVPVENITEVIVNGKELGLGRSEERRVGKEGRAGWGGRRGERKGGE